MKTSNVKKLEYLFGKIYRKTNGNSVNDYLTVSEIDIENFDFCDFCDSLRDDNFFEIEIIYYGSAMDYLIANDASLRNSLEIASEYGFTLENLNSEVLASLLASRNFEEEFYAYQTEIEELISEILEDENAND